MKRFKSRNNKNKNIILFLGIFLVSVAFSIKYLFRENLINNNTLIDILINDVIDIDKTNFTDVEFLIKYALNTELKNSVNVFNEENELIDNKPQLDITNEPLVYIYNTHQTEKYKSCYLETYNISSNVLIASKILKEYLGDLGINSIVEEDDVESKLHSLNWKYGYSYKVSRMFMEKAKQENPSLKYFIDVHRDSSNYDKTTTIIDDENYVRLLFVVGLENSNYEANLNLAEKLSEILKKYNSNLYRGIMKKSGPGVNGVYNQDFDPNVILVEVGGQYNNITEVNNTLKIFAQVLYDYIKEDINEKEKS